MLSDARLPIKIQSGAKAGMCAKLARTLAASVQALSLSRNCGPIEADLKQQNRWFAERRQQVKERDEAS